MKSKIEAYVKLWESRCYPDGIPDEVPAEISDKVPSYKRIVMSILKNDYSLTSLGYQQPFSQVYYDLKHIEIQNRNNMQPKKEVREMMTNTEKMTLQTLQKHPEGLLRGYTESLLRFQDEQYNPVLNIARKTIGSLVEKGYMRLLPEQKFKLL